MSDVSLSRREFSQKSLQSLLTFAFLQTIVSRDAFGTEIEPIAARWIKDLDDLGQSVKDGKLEQIVWQKKVEELLGKVELSELMKFLDFEKLTKDLEFRDMGERSLRPTFPKVEGLPTELVFGHQIFALQKGRSVVPHAHDNMCTAFLILDGTFHGRLYDRLENERRAMIIKPSIDETFKTGQASTISDKKDNIHWFKATSDRAFIFNIHVAGLHDGPTGRIYVDPNGEKLPDGKIRANILKSADAYRMYG
ncbi:MAG TPA: hypothetical protein VMM56_00475 [Planctomycetaceae bacterium]|nr:hypothetical protein [Planctomycetaceae bacterium]